MRILGRPRRGATCRPSGRAAGDANPRTAARRFGARVAPVGSVGLERGDPKTEARNFESCRARHFPPNLRFQASSHARLRRQKFVVVGRAVPGGPWRSLRRIALRRPTPRRQTTFINWLWRSMGDQSFGTTRFSHSAINAERLQRALQCAAYDHKVGSRRH